jgi:aspartate carbamoyltransferase catalytic subunit
VFPAEKCEKTDPHYDSVRPQQIFVQERIEQLHDALKKADVIYVVEDHSIGYSRSNYYAADLALNELALTHIKENAIVMHPMPRGQEMDPAIDKDPRVRIWQQARYSLPVAMALLERIILD